MNRRLEIIQLDTKTRIKAKEQQLSKKKNITQKTKDRATRATLKLGMNSGASEG